jgi:hypothetical protein
VVDVTRGADDHASNDERYASASDARPFENGNAFVDTPSGDRLEREKRPALAQILVIFERPQVEP